MVLYELGKALLAQDKQYDAEAALIQVSPSDASSHIGEDVILPTSIYCLSIMRTSIPVS